MNLFQYFRLTEGKSGVFTDKTGRKYKLQDGKRVAIEDEGSPKKDARPTNQEYANQVFQGIQKTLANGNPVDIKTMTRVTRLQPKHKDMIRVRNGAIQVQRGRKWDYIPTLSGTMNQLAASVGVRPMVDYYKSDAPSDYSQPYEDDEQISLLHAKYDTQEERELQYSRLSSLTDDPIGEYELVTGAEWKDNIAVLLEVVADSVAIQKGQMDYRHALSQVEKMRKIMTDLVNHKNYETPRERSDAVRAGRLAAETAIANANIAARLAKK